MRGADNVRLELDNRERRAVSKSLINRKKLLIEIIHDTTQQPLARRAGLIEAEAIASVLRKLRPPTTFRLDRK